MEHPEGILDGFVIPPDDGDPLSANAMTVAVLAEKHTVPEAFLHPRDFGRQMKNPRRDQQAFGPIGFSVALKDESRFRRGNAFDFVAHEPRVVALRLRPP